MSSDSTKESKSDLFPKVSGNVADVLEWNRQNNWEGLSAKAKVFCYRWVSEFDLGKAAKAISISRERAAVALRNPLVMAFVDDLVSDNRDDSILRREWVELRWLEYYDKVNGDEPIPNITRDGDIVMATVFNAQAAATALKEIGKIAKAYPDGSGGGGGGITVNFDFAALGVSQDIPTVEITQQDPD